MEEIKGWVFILVLALLALTLNKLGDHPYVWFQIPYKLKKPMLEVFAWSLVPFFVVEAWLDRLKNSKGEKMKKIARMVEWLIGVVQVMRILC